MSPVFPRTGIHGNKTTCHRVFLTSFWFISYSGEFYNKKFYRREIRGVDRLKRVLKECIGADEYVAEECQSQIK